jgi:hypothetical protein
VIPAMDHIDKVLATSSDSPHQFTLAIHAALAIGKRAMNHYYNKTDYSDIYWITMGTNLFDSLLLLQTVFLVLHPCHKLEYFKKQKWEVPWVQDTHEIVRRKFDHSYTTVAVCSQKDDVQVANRGLVCYSNSHLQVVDISHYLFQSTNIFNHLPDLAPISSELCNELNPYLAADIEDAKDPLMWWHEWCKTFPHLSQIVTF